MLLERNRQIVKDSKKMTRAELAKKHEVSEARISAILARTEQYCKKHKEYFYTRCASCSAEKRVVAVDLSQYPDLKKEIAAVRKLGRDTASIERRREVARFLSKLGLSAVQIGKELRRHHSSILNLLKSY